MDLDWKIPILDSLLILNLDPRRKKMLAHQASKAMAKAQAAPAVTLPNLEYLESSPRKSSSPRGSSKSRSRGGDLSRPKQWDEVAKAICLHIDKTFQKRNESKQSES